MAITRERFEQGLTYDEYKAQMTRNQERFEENEKTITLPEQDVQFFAGLPQALNVVVLAEDWCGDVIANLPVVGQLAAKSGKLNLRVFLRDQNLDLIDQYLKEGLYRAIPVVVFFDEDFRDLGHWIERPALVNQRQSEMMDALFANDPAMQGIVRGTSPAEMPEEARNRLTKAHADFRTGFRETANNEVVRELRELVSRALATTA